MHDANIVHYYGGATHPFTAVGENEGRERTEHWVDGMQVTYPWLAVITLPSAL